MTPPTTTRPSTTFTARNPADLLALVPIVLGFHPWESVVLLTFGPGGSSFHGRADLPPDPAGRSATVRMFLDAVRRNQVTSAAVVVVTDDAESARAIGLELGDALLEEEIDVLDVIHADRERWWSVRHDDDDRVEPDDPGTPYDVRSHAFTAQRVLEGRATFADRAELAATIEPIEGPEAAAERAEVLTAMLAFSKALLDVPGPRLTVEMGESLRWLRKQVRRRVGGGRSAPKPLSVPTLARLCYLLLVSPGREVICTMLTRDSAEEHVALWSEVVRRAPDEAAEGVTAVLALSAWLAGNGALAWCAIDRCAAVAGDDPTRGLEVADRVGMLLQQAVCPDEWVPLDADDVPLLAG